MIPVVQVQYFYIKNLKVVVEIIASNLYLKNIHAHRQTTYYQVFYISCGAPPFFNALIFKYTKLLNHKICSELRSQASQPKDSLKLILQILMRIIFQFILRIRKIYMAVIILHSLFQAISFRYILCCRLFAYLIQGLIQQTFIIKYLLHKMDTRMRNNLVVVISKSNFKIIPIKKIIRKEIAQLVQLSG